MSSRVRRVFSTAMPRSVQIDCTLRQVMPSSAVVSSGVYTRPSFTMKMFSPAPSATKPSVSSSRPSS